MNEIYEQDARDVNIIWVNLIISWKVECVFPMVIWSEFRLGQYRVDDHREDAPHFNL